MTETEAPAIAVTPKAIEKIRQTFEKQGVDGYLRLGILGGGCSGLSYQFKFEMKSRPNDKLFEYEGGVKVLVDPKSYLYLSGLTLDYKESLMQSGFVFDNPMPLRTAGAERLLPADYFAFFDLPHKLDIDLADLQKRFYELSRKWHPDLAARKSAAEKQEAEDATATLNDAYRTLKDPIRRAEYVLASKGLAIAQQSAPPDLLEQVFELNMALEEMRAGDDSAKPQLLEAKTRFSAMRDEADAQLAEEFKTYDESARALGTMRAILNRRSYIRNLLRDVETELNK